VMLVHDMVATGEVLKSVLPSVDGDSERKSGQVDSAVVDQYKQIIREQVIKVLVHWLLATKQCPPDIFLTLFG